MGNKIVVTTRTYNEEKNVARFIEGYSKIADEIVIVDGGSEDDTVSIAESYPDVTVVPFSRMVEKETKYGYVKRNPQGEHINLCIEMAKGFGADWIIFDDCDCVPTVTLQKNVRDILDVGDPISVYAYRMYVWGQHQWFPDMNIPGPSLWAWKPTEVDIWADESDPWKHQMKIPEMNYVRFNYPYSILHYFAPDREEVERKMNFQRRIYGHEVKSPLQFGGKLEILPEWATWK